MLKLIQNVKLQKKMQNLLHDVISFAKFPPDLSLAPFERSMASAQTAMPVGSCSSMWTPERTSRNAAGS